LIVVVLAIPLGIALKFYDGPARWWVNNWASSIAYEIFFISLVFFFWPRPDRIGRIAVGVCLATCGLEFLQLWKSSWLEAVRSTFVGQSLLGSTFVWWDLPAYPLGCLLGWLLLRTLVDSLVSPTIPRPRW
jgi:hypothetical protein